MQLEIDRRQLLVREELDHISAVRNAGFFTDDASEAAYLANRRARLDEERRHIARLQLGVGRTSMPDRR